MTEWLRPVFGRAKPVPPAANSDRPISLEDSTESEDLSASRSRPASRVSSYLGLSFNSPSLHDPDTFPSFRKPDNVYHAPSGDQMAEILKVAMMSQSSFAPLPASYNSCILHVLEAYQEMRVEISRKEEEIEAMKHTHTETIKDFENMATRWEAKEKDYKAELKNLEVILSRTEGGMEKVTLARTKSTVHGSQKIRDVVRSMRFAKQRDSEVEKGIDFHIDEGSRKLKLHQEAVAPRQNDHNDQGITCNYLDNQIRTQNFNPPPSQPHEAPGTRHRHAKQQSQSTQPAMPVMRSTQAAPENGHVWMDLDKTADTRLGSSDSINELAGDIQVPNQKFVLDNNTQKSVPEISGLPRKWKQYVGEEVESSNSLVQPSLAPSQMGFSFNKGDDVDILGQESSTCLTRDISEIDTGRGPTERILQSESSKLQQKRKSAMPKLKQESAVKYLNPESAFEEGPSLHRFDSTSSVLTAFRAGGRNNSDDSRSDSVGSRRERKSSSSEAITAAVRAVERSRKASDEPGAGRRQSAEAP